MNIFDAVTPDNVDELMKTNKVYWNYPWESEEIDFASGLIKKAYPTKDPKKRMACFMSHYLLWQRCIKDNVPIIIHEHDAIYYNDEPLPLEDFEKSKYNIIGLNNPRGATRLSAVYDRVVQESIGKIVRAPTIDGDMVPQGIAGNSSYYINPTGAHQMASLTSKYGAWPNDALMCRQLVGTLGQTKKYYTYVQGLQSTTSS
jgi:GR25 family glycosyltransferase involved in LPS biosynthesis